GCLRRCAARLRFRDADRRRAGPVYPKSLHQVRPSMHIPPYDNQNLPVVDVDDALVPLAYFNIVRLRRDQGFVSTVPGYETCLVPAHGTIDVSVDRDGSEIGSFGAIGGRTSVWDGEPSA